MKKIIRLTESDLHRIVMETVNSVINETSDEKLFSAIQASPKKISDAKKTYGNNSYSAELARQQLKYFRDAFDKRFDDRIKNAPTLRKKANIEKERHKYKQREMDDFLKSTDKGKP